MPDAHRELRLFLHLCGTLNFGRTSVDCHVSPATLSRSVRRLEAGLGHRLFDRSPRSVSLTTEGHRFREYAQTSLRLWQEYRNEDPDPVLDLTGGLSIFATVTASQALLLDLLAPFRAAHPQVRLDIRTGDAAVALARLDEGEVDAAVAGIPQRLAGTLVARTLAITDLILVTTHDNHRDPLQDPFVLPPRGLVRDAADRWLRRRSEPPVEIAAEPDGHESLLTLVALGCGTGIVPRLVLETSMVRDRLREVPVDPEPGQLTVGLCVRRADLRRPLVAALWNLTDP